MYVCIVCTSVRDGWMTTTTTTRETTSGRRSISDRRWEGPSIDLDDRSIDRRPRRDGNEGRKDGSAFEFISFRFDSFVRLSVRPCLRARERCDDDGVDEIDRVVFRARERGRGRWRRDEDGRGDGAARSKTRQDDGRRRRGGDGDGDGRGGEGGGGGGDHDDEKGGDGVRGGSDDDDDDDDDDVDVEGRRDEAEG